MALGCHSNPAPASDDAHSLTWCDDLLVIWFFFLVKVASQHCCVCWDVARKYLETMFVCAVDADQGRKLRTWGFNSIGGFNKYGKSGGSKDGKFGGGKGGKSGKDSGNEGDDGYNGNEGDDGVFEGGDEGGDDGYNGGEGDDDGMSQNVLFLLFCVGLFCYNLIESALIHPLCHRMVIHFAAAVYSMLMLQALCPLFLMQSYVVYESVSHVVDMFLM